MDFLTRGVRRKFIMEPPFISTKPKDEPPAKFNHSAAVRNSLAGSGAIIIGYVDSSVLFRRVFIGENSSVKNSILMEGVLIGNDCYVEHAVFDKEVVLSDGKSVVGSLDNPVIINKGTVL
jgi:glucose-1-phosphate adenylyltransferase